MLDGVVFCQVLTADLTETMSNKAWGIFQIHAKHIEVESHFAIPPFSRKRFLYCFSLLMWWCVRSLGAEMTWETRSCGEERAAKLFLHFGDGKEPVFPENRMYFLILSKTYNDIFTYMS